MQPKFQKRKDENDPKPQEGGGRRATDTSLRGMQIKVDDSDGAWADWQAALAADQAEPPPEASDGASVPASRAAKDQAGHDDPDTWPSPLKPDA